MTQKMIITQGLMMITMTITKNLALFSIILLTSCQPKTFELTDGTMITQRKADRIIKKCIRKAFRELPKESKKILIDTPVYIHIDTTEN